MGGARDISGTLKKGNLSFALRTVGGEDTLGGGEEMQNLRCMAPKESESGSLYQGKYYMVLACPLIPDIDVPSPQVDQAPHLNAPRPRPNSHNRTCPTRSTLSAAPTHRTPEARVCAHRSRTSIPCVFLVSGYGLSSRG